jgi:hypothetical protein
MIASAVAATRSGSTACTAKPPSPFCGANRFVRSLVATRTPHGPVEGIGIGIEAIDR